MLSLYVPNGLWRAHVVVECDVVFGVPLVVVVRNGVVKVVFGAHVALMGNACIWLVFFCGWLR